MGFFGEFKAFLTRGNVVDLAVAFILGVAFNRIVQSIVKDLLMPPIGLAIGGQRIADRFWVLSGPAGPYTTVDQAHAAGAVTLNYGLFIVAVIEFVIIGFVLFLFVRSTNRLRRKEEKKVEATTKPCPYCASTIAIGATRCPQCTSELDASPTAP